MNKLKHKLAKGQVCFGTHVNLSDHRICEILGSIGFDYLWIDTEHTSTDYKELEIHLIAAKAAGTPAIVRIPWNDAVYVKRVIEMGPGGIVFPMINTKEEAKRAMDACLYPPFGTRGFGPVRAINYGLDDVDTYIWQTSVDMCRFVQIETKLAVENMEEIAQVPYIDGFIIGPCDLSGSINQPNRFMESDTDELINIAIKKSHQAGKLIGLSTGSHSPEVLRHWMSKELDFISAGSDTWGIIQSARHVLETLRHIAD